MAKRTSTGVAVLAWLGLFLNAAASGAEVSSTSYHFQFAPKTITPGATAVLPATAYTAARGYGWEAGSAVTATDGGGVTSDRPFFFSVALPEGDYTVTVTLGDKNEASVTTVKAEVRRLMLEKVQTARGRFVTRAFTVNIRTPQIAGGGEVRLKDRERTTEFRNWDDRLTLEFSNARLCLDAVTITPAPRAVTLFLAGDSTVTDQSEEPWCAWGQMLPRFFRAGVAVANYAESGESLRSFLGAGRLDKILSVMKPGDYLFIQFGHNDQKEHGPGVGAFTTYKADLLHFITETRQRGGLPVVVTSMNRRRFDADGKIVNTLGDYPEAARQTAHDENAPLIDLNAMSKTLFEAMGPQGTLKAFVHYPAGTFPGQATVLKDDTHFNAYGAYELAKCVVAGIKADKLGLVPFLTNDTPPFDPARPDPADAWSLPPDVPGTATKPEGS